MALVLTGVMTGMRPVAGVVEQGPRKGESWAFLSMEVTDTRFGKVYSCQLNDTDPQFQEFVQNGKLAKDLSAHKVKLTVKSQTAGEREIEDKTTKDKRVIIQIRNQVTNVRDLGLPDDED